MQKAHLYNVVPVLPENLAPLLELAYNYLFSWDHELFGLFRRVDEQLWEETSNNPLRLLGLAKQSRLDELSKDDGFLHHLGRVYDAYRRYLTQRTWHTSHYPDSEGIQIAYFSAEYGLARCLPIYSGGLGILSGDHIKSASEMGLPLVGIGLLYQKGYFRQRLNADGYQQERYEAIDFHQTPISLERGPDGEPLRITVECGTRTIHAHIWRAQVGRCRLFLLDTNIPDNAEEDQDIGDYLYGGDQEVRIKQEMMLGIGGVRALAALGLQPRVYHMNEGHAAFMALERIRRLMARESLSFAEARLACAAGNVFTTHTAVPAGFDLFSKKLMDTYLGPMVREMGVDFERFLSIGRGDPFDYDAPFSMALFAARNANFINGVSKLHGDVTKKLFHAAMKDVPVHEIPTGSITNGIHARTWISPEMSTLYTRYLGERWINDPANHAVYERVFDIPDAEFWRVHERRRARLVAFARQRMKHQLRQRGITKTDLAAADELLDPEVLTIGFARRFATYKRATLIFEDMERIKRLLCHSTRPIQLVFAGKAHPLDEPGKKFIREIVHISEDPDVRRRIVFLEDYDIEMARYLVGGVDVWLNNPRRPMEASGTSGMKAIYNGGLNLSILDGWWCEAFDPEVGWAIGAGEQYTDEATQTLFDSRSLYHALEKDIVPMFYDRDVNDLPRRWIGMMKNAIAKLGPFFNTNRMVQEYHERYYAPAGERYDKLSADHFSAVKQQAAWLEQFYRNWTALKVEATEVLNATADRPVGSTIELRARVSLGELRLEQVLVEAYSGPVDESFVIPVGDAYPLDVEVDVGNGQYVFRGSIPCHTSGQQGFLCRIRANLEYAPKMLGMIRWE
jgi:starch phosphorylase